MTDLNVGAGKIDITPPLGLELAGFHRTPSNPRLIEGVRSPTAVRALVLDDGVSRSVVLSIDIIGFTKSFTETVRRMTADATGIPPERIQVCATHTHSTPTFVPLIQWGATASDYEDRVEDACVESVRLAIADLAPADLYIGREKVVGGNFNRTVETSKTDADFTSESSDADRWLDTELHSFLFVRDPAQGDRAAYHFSAHPVCWDDKMAGPDWPGEVAASIHSAHGVEPIYLQGHSGDVNPGDGTPWRGDEDETVRAVSLSLHHALGHGELFTPGPLRFASASVELPFDFDALARDIAVYESDPGACSSGEWVDAEFAAAAVAELKRWPAEKRAYAAEISAFSLGDAAFLFHGAELFSYYGLRIRFDSPFTHTLIVGYANDCLGYLGDPTSYAKREYSAVTVPRILGLPPFTPDVSARFTAACTGLLRKLHEADS